LKAGRHPRPISRGLRSWFSLAGTNNYPLPPKVNPDGRPRQITDDENKRGHESKLQKLDYLVSIDAGTGMLVRQLNNHRKRYKYMSGLS
jgi:hypothetical protein